MIGLDYILLILLNTALLFFSKKYILSWAPIIGASIWIAWNLSEIPCFDGRDLWHIEFYLNRVTNPNRPIIFIGIIIILLIAVWFGNNSRLNKKNIE